MDKWSFILSLNPLIVVFTCIVAAAVIDRWDEVVVWICLSLHKVMKHLSLVQTNQVSSASPPFTASFCVPIPLSLFLRLYIIARLISFGPKCICDTLLQRSLVGLLCWQHKRSTGAVYNMYLIRWINQLSLLQKTEYLIFFRWNQHLATTLRLQQHLRHKLVLLLAYSLLDM